MIPKVIHYCWFGKNPLPELAEKCIASWRKKLPDYDIIEWNEGNFDIKCCDYVKEAYDAKKWAFVSDYVRLFVLVNYGGVYLDVDVEVVKSLDGLLENEAFSGFEDKEYIQTGVMACEKGFIMFQEMLNFYSNRNFMLPNGKPDITTNVALITNFLKNKGLKPNNMEQNILGLKLYPNDYFCPKNYINDEIHCTENTYTIHHFAASWHSPLQKMIDRLKKRSENGWLIKIGVFVKRLLSIPLIILNKFISCIKI